MKKELKNKQNKVYYTVEHDKQNNWVYSNWIGFVSVDDVKEGALTSLSFIEKNRCAYVLNDNTQVTGPWNAANEWLATEWFPKALNLGLRRMAHILSPNAFSAMSAEQLVTKIQGKDFEMRVFAGREEAEQWLLSN